MKIKNTKKGLKNNRIRRMKKLKKIKKAKRKRLKLKLRPRKILKKSLKIN